jgi:formate C-acetyltransferase
MAMETALNQNNQMPEPQVYSGVYGKGLPPQGLITASHRIERLRKRLFDTKASVCVERARIVHEYYSNPKNEALPLIQKRAQAFRAVLSKLSIRIYDDELLVGSLASKSKSYPVIPETLGSLLGKALDEISSRQYDSLEIPDSVKKELREKILPFWEGKANRERFATFLSPLEKQFLFRDPDNGFEGTGIMSANPVNFGSGGHSTLDFPTLLEKGFDGIKEEAVSHLNVLNPKLGDVVAKETFYKAVIECCEGMAEFGRRFSNLAEDMAKNETDPKRREELYNISQVCARVPEFPARNFHEAIQSVWFAYIGILQEDYNRCCPLGRVDSYLYPFYEQDLAKGTLTEEKAQELLDSLWLKLGETNFINWGPYTKMIAGFPVQQQIPVGGMNKDGKDGTNPLTLKCIQATMNTRLNQPSLSVRLHSGSPSELYRKASELARMGTGHPSFFNDEVVVPGLVKDGISIEDARDYSPVGCVGVQVSGCGKGSHNGGYLNSAAALEFALTDGYLRNAKRQLSINTGDPRDFATFEEFWNAFEQQFRHIIRILLGVSVKAENMHKQYSPTPFMSSLTEGCLENGSDRTDGSARYNLGMSFRATGIADVADSLAAVKKFVYDEKTVSMDDLLKALDDNFEGNEVLRQTLLTGTPRYGNGNKLADDIARKVLNILSDEASQHKSYFGGSFQMGYGSVSAHWPFGSVLGAFPDGRKAGEPLTDGISPAHRQPQNVPTAVLQSVGGMDHAELSGGSILNLKFHPETVKGEKGLETMVSFLKNFVKLGVWHCQFNIFDADMLREAQSQPDNYRDLMVRVAGYSAYFTGLPKVLQDDIIARTEHYF